MSSIEPKELERLVSVAVQRALQQRKISDAELAQLLHGPITIGLVANPQHLSLAGQEGESKLSLPGIHDKERLIGFVAPNVEKLADTLKSK